MQVVGEREKIAMRVAKELKNGDVVNLGIGMPTMVADYVPEEIRIVLQSENGILGMGSVSSADSFNKNIVNAGGKNVTVNKGVSFFDSTMSFTIIRGGHVDITVLGALQVDEEGGLASHIIPGKMVSGMGGAMDLVTGSKKVIIAMTHTAKDGKPKIMKTLTLPATAVKKVHLIVTEMAVMEVTDKGLVLKEVAEGLTVQQVQDATEVKLIVENPPSAF